MVKKGDTLVEVALAVGILSMIAISITAVISSSTSGAQTALETTLTREEVDAQSEALRFIQDSYVTNKNTTESNKFDDLWAAIADAAYDPKNAASGVSADDLNAILKFNPGTCQNIYNNNFIKEHAFVINPRQLSAYINGESGVDADDVVVRSKNSTKFIAAPIFPRLTFGTALNNSSSDDLMDNTDSRNLYRAEGIFVIAVKDDGHTAIVDENSASGAVKKEQAFYDFYIHTCWYGANANEPSTVSTVIRLYDPGSVTSLSGRDQRIMVSYYENIVDLSMGKEAVKSEQSSTSGNYTFRTCAEVLGGRPGVDCNKFRGWRDSRDGVIHQPGENITGSGSESRYFKVSAAWRDKHYIVYFNNNSEMYGVCAYPESGALPNNASVTIYKQSNIESSACLDKNKFNRNGYQLKTWNTKSNYSGEEYIPRSTYRLPMASDGYSDDLVLYAKYEPFGLFYKANGGSFIKEDGEIYDLQPTNCPDGCNISDVKPTRSGYEFLGWCRRMPSGETCSDGWGIKNPGDFVRITEITDLYAVWRPRNETITIKLEWQGPADLDSHVEGFKSNGTKFHAYYSNMVGSDIDGTTIASLNTDSRSTRGAETFTINTFGGRDYYYYVYAFDSSSVYNARVTVSGPYSGTKVYCSGGSSAGSENANKNEGCDGHYATGTGRYWNVFAYKNGTVVVKQTRTSSPDLDY